MDAGKLNKYITIQYPARSANSIGEWIETWTNLATVWAEISPLSGNRLFQAQQANSEVTGVIRIRYRRDFKPTWRLKLGTRIFKIVSIVNPNEANQELDIYYKEELD